MAGVFDKITSRINKSVATVGANSKAMVEKSQIKTIIKNLENERKQLAELLGMKIYDTYKESEEMPEDESTANFIMEIKKRLNMIAEQETALKQVDEKVSLVTGAKVVTGETKANCTCGQPIKQGAKFCAKCGSAL